MAEKKQLGAFWGEETLCFVETISSNANKLFNIPLAAKDNSQDKQGIYAPKGLSSSPPIHDYFYHQKITASSIHLSLPIKDIIFRSFVVPWMQASEVTGAVEFEASKYIPFSLEELSYSFHSITITENSVKRLRIIFVAIKKDTLERYLNAFEQAGLQVDIIEPAAFSLIRALSMRGLIPANETVAIIEKRGTSGKIIVVDQDIPQFSREFQIKPLAPPDTTESGLKALLQRLVNEVRISLDYFNRQESQIRVKKIILLTSVKSQELSEQLAEDLGKPITSISLDSIFGEKAGEDLGYLSAFGAALGNPGNSPINFQLSKKKIRNRRSTDSPQKQFANYQSVIFVLILCASAIMAVFFYSNKLLYNPKAEETALSQQLGNFRSSTVETLNNNNETLRNKLVALENIRVKSQISYFLSILPDLLPDGAWLKNLVIAYVRPPLGGSTAIQNRVEKEVLSLELSGFAYVEDTREQFRLVNTFLKNLKETNQFSSYFENIDLKTIRSQKLNNFTVTSFEIKCE